ncbi:two-partner secretion domain-containing protein [Hydrogenovibrio kuenenii]|uniref:two-partner secretion domain-containing protein n=1 Tax=Hydrogenovibrio kuenenii TaxID=63658 RepID=UPI0004B1F11C|nr:filamentous hemagglutinin N-terminal domain-containing protein [Hydrogenovibrio kuenenii]
MKHANHKLKRPSMNHTYRLVWSDAQQMFIPVAEGSSAKGKSHVALTLATLLLGCSLNAYAIDSSALPTGANITHGSAAISQSGNTLTIQQNSDKLITNWNTFNVGENATVNFVQPSISSASLNRVLDNNPSQILGHLNANGQVYLINPNGIVFGQNAQVDVGGLIASTLNISDDDFLNNKLQFSKTDLNNGTIKNLGYIKAHGGIVALIGQQVDNQGTVLSNQGNVALAAGDQVTLDFSGDGLMKVSVDKGVVDALVHNGGLVQADGGLVVMTTQARNDIYKNLINNDGIVQAQTLASKDGKILLLGGMTNGTVTAAGTLDASAPTTGNGGFIETSAATVKAQPDLKVTTQAQNGQTGTWLIDPRDYTIAASGGNMTGALSSSILATSNMYIQSTSGSNPSGNGDIFVNDTITWSSGNSLQLIAQRNITINSTINARGGSGGDLYLEYGQGSVTSGNTATYSINAPINLQTGFNFWTKQGSDGALTGWRVITALGAAGSTTGKDLQGISGNLAGNYVLGANIDASATSSWNGGTGFSAIGTVSTHSYFTGKLDGLGHTISHLTINDSSSSAKGIFATTSGATIQNLGLANFNITGSANIGALVGYAMSTTISNVHVSNTQITATGTANAGGIAGQAINNGKISHSYVDNTVNISAPLASNVGGLVGNNASRINESYSQAQVKGKISVGGLIGKNANAIKNSYATGSVNSTNGYVGGLVGLNVRSSDWTTTGSITNSYASGSVTSTATTYVGGLVGQLSQGTVSNSFWDTSVTGISSGTGTGLTSTEMKNPFKFIDAGWDFTNIWGKSKTGNNSNLMVLKNFDNTTYNYYVRTNSSSQTYGSWNASPFSLDGIGASNVTASVTTRTNAGQYNFNDTGVVNYSYSKGAAADYYFNYGTAKLTIAKRLLTLNYQVANKTYDGNTSATASFTDNRLTNDVLSIQGTANFVDKNAGNNKTVNISNIQLSGTNAGNYYLASTSATASANILASNQSTNNSSTTSPSDYPKLDPSSNQNTAFNPADFSNQPDSAPAPNQTINTRSGTSFLNGLENNYLWRDQRQNPTTLNISGKKWAVNFMQVGHQMILMSPQNEPFSSADLPEVLEQSNYQDADHAKKVVFQLTDKVGNPINVTTHITSDGKAIIDVPTQLGNTFKKEELSLVSFEALKQLGVDMSKISQIILNKVVI